MPHLFDEKKIKEKYVKFKQKNPEFDDFRDSDILPCIEYKSEKWLKKPIRALFIAESPPWSHIENNKDYVYFYNENFTGKPHCLADHIFDGLGISGENRQEKLKKFSDKGFFLTDTIKCIIKKRNLKGQELPKALLKGIANFSAEEILKNEIESLNPDNIVVIGKTALKAVKIIAKDSRYKNLKNAYEDLKNINRYKDIISPEMFAKYHLFFVPFPDSRTLSKKHNNETLGEFFDETFKKLKEIPK